MINKRVIFFLKNEMVKLWGIEKVVLWRIEKVGLWRVEEGLRRKREREDGYDKPKTRVMITIPSNKGWVTITLTQ